MSTSIFVRPEELNDPQLNRELTIAASATGRRRFNRFEQLLAEAQRRGIVPRPTQRSRTVEPTKPLALFDLQEAEYLRADADDARWGRWHPSRGQPHGELYADDSGQARAAVPCCLTNLEYHIQSREVRT